VQREPADDEDRVALERVRRICLGFARAEEAELQAEVEALRQDRRFAASPHHGNRGWMALRLDTRAVDWDEVAELLESAYRQVLPRTSMTE